jgi:hypothetical protein
VNQLCNLKRSEAAPVTQNQMGAASFREQPLRASSEAHTLHPQCGHDTALAWRDYPICGENGGKRAHRLAISSRLAKNKGCAALAALALSRHSYLA